MTFEKATPYIRKICTVWVSRWPNYFEVDELFNEVWLRLGGDCSQFGEAYPVLGITVHRRLLEYLKSKGGRPGSYRNSGERRTRCMEDVKHNLESTFDGFNMVDSDDEWDWLMFRVRPTDQPLLEMYYREGLKQEEIGKKLRCTKSGVSLRLTWIIDRLRRKLERAA